MELIWKELDAERLICRQTVQAAVEGMLPTPDGTAPAEVFSCGARVLFDSCTVDTGAVRLEGRIAVSVTAADAEGRIFAYESYAGFKHVAEIPDAQPGMKAEAAACIQSLGARPEGKGVELSAGIDLDIRLTSSLPLKLTGGVSGVNDLEMRQTEIELRRKLRLGKETVRMREELEETNISEVISCEGIISVEEVSVSGESAAVSGTVTVEARVTDGDGIPSQIVRRIPFRERIRMERGCDEAYCRAELRSLFIRSLGEEFGLLTLEAEIGFELLGVEREEITAPADAFSPTIGFGCLTESVRISDYLGLAQDSAVIREEIAVPEGLADIERAVFASARAIVTETRPDGEKLTVSGVFAASVTYESEAGRRYLFSRDIPFSVDIAAPIGVDSVSADASCTVNAERSGARSVSLEFTLALVCELFGEKEYELLAGLAERETAKGPGGIVICFASEGETVFDAAKRYSVPCESVRRLNPDITEPFHEGDKLILLV